MTFGGAIETTLMHDAISLSTVELQTYVVLSFIELLFGDLDF